MSSQWDITVEGGRHWLVGAFTVFGEPKHYPSSPPNHEHAEIIIPVCQIDGLSPEEIGEIVLDMIPTAKTCYAEHVAVAYIGSNQLYQRNASGESLENMIFRDLPLLEKHQNDKYARPEIFSEAIRFLREMKDRYEARELRKRFKVHPARKEVSKNYDSLFMRVGRRDGFHCGNCKITKNLHLDHIKPVSVGGTSEAENLQLLCGSCNSKKGDKTVDYRQEAEAVA